jgi:hypothetical protein
VELVIGADVSARSKIASIKLDILTFPALPTNTGRQGFATKKNKGQNTDSLQ